jgi:hypothetical protein
MGGVLDLRIVEKEVAFHFHLRCSPLPSDCADGGDPGV